MFMLVVVVMIRFDFGLLLGRLYFSYLLNWCVDGDFFN